MKRFLILLLFPAICGLAQVPQVNIPITINDGAGGNQVLYFGLDPTGTDEMDAGLGELPLPPMPPLTVFDARFNLPNGTESSFRDYRQGSNTFSGIREYKLQYQTGNGTVINIIWNLMPGITGVLQDLFGGVVVNVNMAGSGSYQVANPGALDKLKMMITYSQPSLVIPQNGAENISLTPTLTWNALSGSTKYGLFVATDNNFTNVIFSDTTITQTTKTLTNSLNPYTTYFWRVRGINENGSVLYSETWNFRTIRLIGWANLQWPGAQTILRGESVTAYGRVYIDGVTQGPGAGAGILAWIGYSESNTNPDGWTNWIVATYNQDSGNNDEYMGSFGSTLATGTYYFASRFQYNGGPYSHGGYSQTGGGFWNGTSNISGVLNVLSELPGVPNLISPPDNSINVSILPTLVWNTPVNATIYRLQISTDAGFSSMVLNDSTVTDTAITLSTQLEKTTKYYWRVSAKNGSGASAFSGVRNFTTADTTTGVGENHVVEDFELYQNYPNPFNPVTVIEFQIPVRSNVLLKIYDVTGNEVEILVNEELEAGRYRTEFDAAKLTSGIYFCSLISGEYRSIKKMILIK
ncbi:MAG: T9SS type A sorting domain-containing protein [Ignavibacteriaceae bacterium]